jgi:hypothetical protein
MPELTAIARAVSLAVRAKPQELTAEARQILMNVKPLVMMATGYVSLKAKAAGQSLEAAWIQTALSSVVRHATLLKAVPRTSNIPKVSQKSSLINAYMLGDSMLG